MIVQGIALGFPFFPPSASRRLPQRATYFVSMHVSAFGAVKYAIFSRPSQNEGAHYRRQKTYDQTEHLPYNIPVLSEEDKQWITERLEKVETNLLTEFHKWASPVELRQRSHAAVLRALDAEVESVSDRLKNLEGRR
jgi:hypothetical protein